MAITTYELTGYANGAAVKSALDKAGTALQSGAPASSIAVTPTATVSSTDAQNAFDEIGAKVSSVPVLFHVIAMSLGAL